MARPVICDGLRLYLGISSATPRGVNRVDHVYGRYFVENWPGECCGVLPTPWGVRLYDRDLSRRMLAYVQNIWRENLPAGIDPAFSYFQDRLLNGSTTMQQGETRRRRHIVATIPRFVREFGLHLGRSVVRAAPRNAIYLNVGQVCWASPITTRWLHRRPDIRAVFMLHDVIPLERPELVSRASRMEMDWMLRTVIERAAGLLTTTEAASDAVIALLRQRGLPDIPVCALHLPVDDVFLRPDPPDRALHQHSYFLACGAIERRKNLLLLLKVWERLVERFGPATPKLVLAGTMEMDGEPIQQHIMQSEALRRHVIVVSGLGSPSLRQIMANARALLMPSLAEGFGLPVVEAFAVGLPVLASDIPALREVGGDLALYIDPMDEAGWFDAVAGLIDDPEQDAALRRRLATYRPVTESDYFGRIRDFLESLD